MKEPYGEVLDAKIQKFAKLGLSESCNEEYMAVFSMGNCSIEIEAERYYLPSLTTRFIDKDGNIYSLRIIREMLDKDSLYRDSKKLESTKLIYKLDDVAGDENLRSKGINAYLSLSFDQLLDFLSKYLTTLADCTGSSFRTEYLKRESDLLGRLGL